MIFHHSKNCSTESSTWQRCQLMSQVCPAANGWSNKNVALEFNPTSRLCLSSMRLFNWQWNGYVYIFETFYSIWVWAFRQIEQCCAAGIWSDVLGRHLYKGMTVLEILYTYPELLFTNQEIMTTMQLYKSLLDSIFQNLAQIHFKYYIKFE